MVQLSKPLPFPVSPVLKTHLAIFGKCIIQNEESGGLSKFYVCNNPANFTLSGVDNYEYIGNLARAQGYIKSIIFGENGEIGPSEIGGGSTTYFCDTLYTNVPSSGESERAILLGGFAMYPMVSGLMCVNTNFSATSVYVYFGTRLCFTPNYN